MKQNSDIYTVKCTNKIANIFNKDNLNIERQDNCS